MPELFGPMPRPKPDGVAVPKNTFATLISVPFVSVTVGAARIVTKNAKLVAAAKVVAAYARNEMLVLAW
jgi:hypothetical protein